MTEIPATLESEHTPEPKWPERIIVCHARTLDGMGDFDLFVPRVSENAEEEATGWCNSQGYTAYRILRVSPPVERRVEIDWAAVEKEVGLAFPQIRKEMFKRFILRHARIVEEPKL